MLLVCLSSASQVLLKCFSSGPKASQPSSETVDTDSSVHGLDAKLGVGDALVSQHRAHEGAGGVGQEAFEGGGRRDALVGAPGALHHGVSNGQGGPGPGAPGAAANAPQAAAFVSFQKASNTSRKSIYYDII